MLFIFYKHKSKDNNIKTIKCYIDVYKK